MKETNNRDWIHMNGQKCHGFPDSQDWKGKMGMGAWTYSRGTYNSVLSRCT